MKNLKKISIQENSTIKEALEIINVKGQQIAIIVDNSGKLLGTLTDGDIRRGLLKGLNLESQIKSIYVKNPTTALKTDDRKKLMDIAITKKILQIPIVDKNNKFIDLYLLNDSLKPIFKSNLVVIMAGGKGTRLRPLTETIPKPMLKIGEKPILQIIIDKFKENNFNKFVICVNYKSKLIKDYFGNGSKFNVDIKYINEKKEMGTAGALSLLTKKPKEPFFVINADVLTNLNFDSLLNFHNYYNSAATMCIREYFVNSPYGEVEIDNEKIISIEEKPIHKFYVNTGIYVLGPKCLKFIPKKFFDMTSLFQKIIEKKLLTTSFPIDDYWLDIGRFEDFKQGNLEFRSFFKK